MVDRLSRVAEGLEMSVADDDETDRRPDGWAEASQQTGRQGWSCGARRDLVSREESSWNKAQHQSNDLRTLGTTESEQAHF